MEACKDAIAPCFVIAEAGVNHNGDLMLARRLIDGAVEAGANAVKFQTFKAEKLVTQNAPKAEYQKKNSVTSESQFEMLKRLELSSDAHEELWTYCKKNNIAFISTPFDEESADFLEALGMETFKIPSGEVTNIPFLQHIARKHKPMIVSTGMAYLSEVETAVRTIREAGNRDITLLHCVSNYPAQPADVNLRAIQTMKAAFGLPVGYSDHTLGIEVCLAAVALGATVIEKHFTLDRSLPGPDHLASLEPSELKAMITGLRNIEAALGHGRKEPAKSELAAAAVARRSLIAARDIAAGETLTESFIAIKRPGTGLPPSMRPYLVGRTAKHDIPADTLLTLEMLV